MKKARCLNLEIGSVAKFQKNNKLPNNFIALLISKFKNKELKPVYKPLDLANSKRHYMGCTEKDWAWLQIQARKSGLKIGKEGASGLIRALINGEETK